MHAVHTENISFSLLFEIRSALVAMRISNDDASIIYLFRRCEHGGGAEATPDWAQKAERIKNRQRLVRNSCSTWCIHNPPLVRSKF